MQMKAEGFRKVEMKRGEVPSPPSKLFTYSLLIILGEMVRVRNRTKKVAKVTRNGLPETNETVRFTRETGKPNAAHCLLFWFNNFGISSFTKKKELVLFTVDFFFLPVDEITEA